MLVAYSSHFPAKVTWFIQVRTGAIHIVGFTSIMSYYTLLVSNFYVNCALLIAVTWLFALLLGEFRTTAKGQIDLRPRASPSGHPPPL